MPWCQPQRATESDKHHLSKKQGNVKESGYFDICQKHCAHLTNLQAPVPLCTLYFLQRGDLPSGQTNLKTCNHCLGVGVHLLAGTLFWGSSWFSERWRWSLLKSALFNKPPCLEPLWLSDAGDKQCFHWKRDVTNCKDGLISLYREWEWMEGQTEDSGLFACFAATIKPGALWQGSCMHY